MTRSRGLLVALVLLAAGLTPLAPTGAAGQRAVAGVEAPGTALGTLPLLHATRGEHPGIFDAGGRQLVLRGVNLNSLGDYYQANPRYAPTVPVTGTDWDLMAAQGFNSVRLLVSWSKLEPAPGNIDAAYIDRIHAAVDAAAARGIYSIIDMHQDAWGKYIASPSGVACATNLHPAIGWDGAPEWATLTDGTDTCNGGSREDSEAVRTAWDSFWNNREGIQTHLTGVWARLATEFAADPAVAGYDLLNEPGNGHPQTPTAPSMASFYRNTIAAIRHAEANSGAPGHMVFFEYSVNGEPVPAGFSNDPNLVFAPHVYGGSIGPITVSANWGYVKYLADQYKATIWSGEYGWFADPAANQPKLIEFGQIEDSLVAGSAWWQWRQACGDPHTIGSPGGDPPPVLIHYQINNCPGDVNGGPVPEWRTVVGRPYPRALPGRITELSSRGLDATLTARGDLGDNPVNREFVVWVPERGATMPNVGGQSVADIKVQAVTGGFLASGVTCGSTTYQVQVGGDAVAAPATCPPAPVPVGSGGAGAAAPVESRPAYTG